MNVLVYFSNPSRAGRGSIMIPDVETVEWHATVVRFVRPLLSGARHEIYSLTDVSLVVVPPPESAG